MKTNEAIEIVTNLAEANSLSNRYSLTGMPEECHKEADRQDQAVRILREGFFFNTHDLIIVAIIGYACGRLVGGVLL